MPDANHPSFRPLPIWVAAVATVIAGAGYGLAFATTWGAAGILTAMPCMFLLGRMPTPRKAFYGGLLAGLAAYVPQLWFFASIFKWAAGPIWLIAGLPIAAFSLLLHLTHRRWGSTVAVALAPVLWTGIEFFRSELYSLRFAWLMPGQAMAFQPGVRLLWLGVYGVGFLYAIAATLVFARQWPLRLAGLAATVALAIAMYWPPLAPANPTAALHVAGVQLEFPGTGAVVDAIHQLAAAHPEAQLLVLSENTFLGQVPLEVRDAVRSEHRYLIAGARRLLDGDQFQNVAVVIGPDGTDRFEQAKSVPVQFMADGVPAQQRLVWSSPWGPIGLAICYDLSYARVMDDFVRQGARGLIVPTMDVESWGGFERRMLHGRMAPVRSAEYGLPTFGVWSSGTSQLTDRTGRVIATAGYPGQGDVIAGPFDLSHPGHIPPDRPFAMAATLATAGVIVLLAVDQLLRRRTGAAQ